MIPPSGSSSSLGLTPTPSSLNLSEGGGQGADDEGMMRTTYGSSSFFDSHLLNFPSSADVYHHYNKRIKTSSLDDDFDYEAFPMDTTTQHQMYKRSVVSPFLIYLLKGSGIVLDFPDRVLFGEPNSHPSSTSALLGPTVNTALIEYLKHEGQVDMKQYLPAFLSLFFQCIKEQSNHFSSIATFSKIKSTDELLAEDMEHQQETKDIFMFAFRKTNFSPVAASNVTDQPNEVDIVLDFLHDLITHEYMGAMSSTAHFVLTELIRIMNELPKSIKLDYDIEICKRYLSFINDILKSICTYSIRFASPSSSSRGKNEEIILETLITLFRVMVMFLSTNNRSCTGRDEELKVIVNDLIFRVASMIPFYKLMTMVYSMTNQFSSTQIPLSIIQDLKVKKQKLDKILSFSCENSQALIFLQHIPVYHPNVNTYVIEGVEHDVNFKFSSSIPKRGSSEWIRRVQKLCSALSQHIHPDTFELIVKGERSVKASDDQKKKKYKFNFTSDMIHEAMVLRILQLLDEKETYPCQYETMFSDVSKSILGKWILLANQLDALISRSKPVINMKMIFFGETELADATTLHFKGNYLNFSKESSSSEATYQILSLRKCVELFGDHMKDHNLVWLLLQIVMTKRTRFDGDPLLIREFIKLVSELRYKNFATWHPFEENLLQSHTHMIQLRLREALVEQDIQIEQSSMSFVKEMDTWFKETAINYHNPDENTLKNIFLLSNYLIRPLGQSMYNYLMSNSEDEPVRTIPHDATDIHYEFTGKRKPLSVNLILVISVMARRKLFGSILELLRSKQIKNVNSNEHFPPGIIETLARALYCTPVNLNETLGELKINNFLIVELLNFRLIRLLKYCSPENFFTLFMTLHTQVGSSKESGSHRLFLILENLGVKMTTYLLNDFKRMEKLVDKHLGENTSISETLKRNLLFSFIRNFKLSWKQDKHEKTLRVSCFNKIVSHCMKVMEDFGKLNSKHRLYPELVKKMVDHFLSKKTEQTESPPYDKDTISKIEKQLDAKNLQEIVQENNRNLLCAIWSRMYNLLPKQPSNEEVKFWKKVLLETHTPKELVNNIYRFVDYILDEYLVEGENNTGETIYLVMQRVSQHLAKFVWTYEFVPIEIMTLALMDRSKAKNTSLGTPNSNIEHIYAHSVLLSILITDEICLAKRANCFLRHNKHPNHFEDPDYFDSHQKYHAEFPETFGASSLSESQSRPCYYGNECLRMIPILDLFCRRLCELQLFDTLQTVLETYGDLFLYHEFLLTFVKDILFTFHHEITMDCKKLLFNIVRKSEDYTLRDMNASFSKTAKDYFLLQPSEAMTPNTSQSDIFDRTYFLKLITCVSEVLPTIQESRANHTYITPKHVFYEFTTTFELRLNACVIEILCLPLGLTDIVKKLIECLIENMDLLPRPQLYKLSHTIGLILASLPPTCGDYVFAILAEFLSKNPHLLLINDLENKHELQSIKSPAECMLCILHNYLHTATNEAFSCFKKFLKQRRKSEKCKIETREQFYFLCRVIGPFITPLAQLAQSSSLSSSSSSEKPVNVPHSELSALEVCFTEIVMLFLSIEWDVSPEIRPVKKRKYSSLLSTLFQQNDGNEIEDEMVEQIFYFFQHVFHLLYPSGQALKNALSWKHNFISIFNEEIEKCTNAALKQRLKMFFTAKDID